MTSMIDVVFLLLIFFLVTTTFVRPERELPAQIKVQADESSQSKTPLEPAVVDVRMVGGQPRFYLGAVEAPSARELLPRLRLFEDPSLGAFVRVADDVPYEAAAQAMGACREAGFSGVSYLPLR